MVKISLIFFLKKNSPLIFLENRSYLFIFWVSKQKEKLLYELVLAESSNFVKVYLENDNVFWFNVKETW